MVDFHDRRYSPGKEDFNNPSGSFGVTTHGYDEADKWSGLSANDARADVHNYFRSQKSTATWHEATRLAKQRTDRQSRAHGFTDGAQYGNAYLDHLVRVMATKGEGIAASNGELKHPQTGYGRL